MVEDLEVKVDTDIKCSCCRGRNGVFNIKRIKLWIGASGVVYVEGIGKRNMCLNGGFAITVEAMDELAKKWLEARQLEPKKLYIEVSGGLVNGVWGPSGFKSVIIDHDNETRDDESVSTNKELQAELEDMKVAGVVVALDQN